MNCPAGATFSGRRPGKSVVPCLLRSDTTAGDVAEAHALYNELHYLSCESGVGQQSRTKGETSLDSCPISDTVEVLTMWRTCEGERVLQGAEWELFAAGLAGLWDVVEEALLAGQSAKFGLTVFDDLQPTQQLALLALVAQALHDETAASPPLTAHNEGAVAAVFAHIGDRLEDEIDRQVNEPAEMSVAWRQRVLAASQEHEPDPEEPLPDRRNTDPEEWDLLMDCLESRIFWDSDYAMGGAFLDDAPDKSQQLMSEMGIADDYFIAVAPDPTDKELDAVRQILRQLTGRSEQKMGGQ